MQKTVTLKLSNNEAESLKERLGNYGYTSAKPTNPYVLWRMNGKGITVMYYSKGSLVAQGEGDFSIFTDKGNHENEKSDSYTSHIGSDEVGKGDYFGPLVVCSAFVEEKDLDLIKENGITDSKKLSDSKMLKIFEMLKDVIKYQAVIAYPEEYNQHTKEYKNVSYFLASLHRRAVEGLLGKINISNPELIIDQFSLNKGRLENEFKGLNVNLTQFHKGESDIAVATASVFARAIFVQEFENMSEKYGMIFPKGATNVINFGKDFVKKYGQEELKNVAKISFRTTSQVLGF